MLNGYRHILVGLLLLCAPPLAARQAVDLADLDDLNPVTSQTNQVTWTIWAEPNTVQAGAEVVMEFVAEIEPGWKLYTPDSPAGKPISVQLDGLPAGWTVGPLQQAPHREGYDPNFDATVHYYETEGHVWTDLAVPAAAPAGTVSLQGTLTYMFCSERVCIPSQKDFAVPVQVTAAPVAATGPATLPPATVTPPADDPPVPDTVTPPETPEEGAVVRAPAGGLDRARSGGLWSFLLIAMGAGLAVLLTPCVFPMIPLTISFFTHHSGTRRQAVRMALLYGIAIVGTFTGLGLLMAVLVGAAGAQTLAANPWVNLFIAVILVVFALSLLGMFELRLPHRLVNYFNQQGNTRQGFWGVLFMGFTLTLVTFSCTAPFVGGLLAATARNEWTWPVLGMVVFSSTFALPFVLFALFPNWLHSLPKSGSWMNAVKVSFGFIELAAAFKFLSNADLVWEWALISRPLVIACWVVIFALTGWYLLGKLQLAHAPLTAQVGVPRLLFAIGFLGFSLYLLPGLLGAPLNAIDAWLPPRQATDMSLLAGIQTDPAHRGDLGWHSTHDQPAQAALDGAFAEAQAQNKPVFIDFTGYTCTNCRQMEATVFIRPGVSSRLRDRFVLLQLYTDDGTDGRTLQKYQLQLTGTVALPTYAIVSPNGVLLDQWEGMASAEAFTAFLDDGVALFEQGSLAGL